MFDVRKEMEGEIRARNLTSIFPFSLLFFSFLSTLSDLQVTVPAYRFFLLVQFVSLFVNQVLPPFRARLSLAEKDFVLRVLFL